MHLLKNTVLVVFGSLLLVGFATSQDSQKRTSLLNKRAGTRNVFQKSTTTTEEPIYDDEEYVEGGQLTPENEEQYEDQSASTTSTTTTEATRKVGISVRPFRSNEDLLSALKKRRLNEKNNKSSATQKPVQEEKQAEPEVKTTKAKPTVASSFAVGGHRRFGAHKPTNIKAPVQDNHAQTIEDPTSKPFKRSNRFTLRQ